AADGPVKQAQHVETLQRLDPVAKRIELSGRIHAADQRAHRRAGDTADVETLRDQFLDHADVRITACAAGAEHEGNAGSCHRRTPDVVMNPELTSFPRKRGS